MKNHEQEFEQAQYKLYTYIDWLYNSGRLTAEEHSNLIDSITDCSMKAITFGSEEVE